MERKAAISIRESENQPNERSHASPPRPQLDFLPSH